MQMPGFQATEGLRWTAIQAAHSLDIPADRGIVNSTTEEGNRQAQRRIEPLEQAQFPGVDDRFGPSVCSQLAEQVVGVPAHGIH